MLSKIAKDALALVRRAIYFPSFRGIKVSGDRYFRINRCNCLDTTEKSESPFINKIENKKSSWIGMLGTTLDPC
jgi:hypothetical protein